MSTISNWWKNPLLSGPENDYGDYDFYAEELPKDSAKWEWFYEKCESCGKYHHLNFCSSHYFYCWDGWDSMTYVECWRCVVKDTVHKYIRKIKGAFKLFHLALEFKLRYKKTWEKSCELAKALSK